MAAPLTAQAAPDPSPAPYDPSTLPAAVQPIEELAVEMPAEQCQGGGNAEVCVEFGTPLSAEEEAVGLENAPDSLAPIPTAGAQARAYQPVPQWCLDRGVTNRFASDRLLACGIFSARIDAFQTINGVRTQTGTSNYLFYHFIYPGGTGVTTWGNQIRVTPTSASGTAVNFQVTGAPSCTGACVLQSFTFPPAAPRVGQNADGESFFSWTGQAGEISAATGKWTISWSGLGLAPTAPLTLPGIALRCDNAVPGARAGCVFAQFPAVMYYGIDSFPNLGRHIALGQDSGLPGSYLLGSPPLHRMTDSAANTANRAAACPTAAWLPRPTGLSCDEYPFASTSEGAATGGGTARTFTGCSVTLQGPPSTGPTGFSICMIPATENSRGGSVLNSQLFVRQRVVNGDPFYVDVVSGP